MKYLLGVTIRILALPIYLLIITLGIIELLSIVFSLGILQFIYQYIFQIKYKDIRNYPPTAGSEILWDKLTNQLNKL